MSATKQSPRPRPRAILSLTGLEPFSELDLSFDFIAIDNWASEDSEQYFSVVGPNETDYIAEVQNVGVPTAQLVLNVNITEDITGGATLILGDGTSDVGQPGAADSLWRVALSGFTADANGNATFYFDPGGSGWQGGPDEAVGLDNIVVNGTLAEASAPEPASAMFLGLGLGALLLRGRFARQM